MKILVSRNRQKPAAMAVEKGATPKSVMKAMAVSDQTVIVKVNGQVAHEGTELCEGDKLELVGIIYGG